VYTLSIGAARADAPKGWYLAGSSPRSYTVGADTSVVHSGHASGALRSRAEVKDDGFGTLMQTIRAGTYAGQRVRLSAWVRADLVAEWAGVWMRVDSADGKVLAFDNMQSRPITGTVGWTQFAVVLDVDKNAADIAFGILLAGTGAVWLDDVRLEPVDQTVPTTASGGRNSLPERPENLGFDD
jgi:hypothetical protein